MSLDYTWIDLRICWVLDRLAAYRLPRALDSLLMYQQPSSTTLYYSYQEHPSQTEARLSNETREITESVGLYLTLKLTCLSTHYANA